MTLTACLTDLQRLLDESARLHRHLCPRQVLGVRIGLQGGALLNLSVPQTAKRLLTLVETDGCFADGVSTATNCWVGRRTLRVEDLGKAAATFVDTENGRAVRVWPREGVRAAAQSYAPDAINSWQGQLLGYQRMPADELLTWRDVVLRVDIGAIVSRPGRRVVCEQCGEEVLNGREVHVGAQALCRSCAGSGYCDFRFDSAQRPGVSLNRSTAVEIWGGRTIS